MCVCVCVCQQVYDHMCVVVISALHVEYVERIKHTVFF